MVPWDSDKSTATDPDNPTASEQLTADEWDAHVSEGHFPSNELNFGTNASGNPVITDPQNADAVVAEYDRGNGEWVYPAISTDEIANVADFVVGSLSELNNAISNAAAGDTILAGQGTYAFESADAIAPAVDDLTIKGQPGTVFTFADGIQAEFNLIEPDGENVTIESIEFDGNATNTTAPSAHGLGSGVRADNQHVTVRDCHFHDFHMRCLQSYSADHLTATNNRFENWANAQNEPAVNMDHGCVGWEVAWNYFDNAAGGTGAAVTADGSALSSSEHKIAFNDVYNVTGGSCIFVGGSAGTRTLVIGNHTYDSGSIRLDSGAATARDNTIHFPAGKGIIVAAAGAVESDNTIIGATADWPILLDAAGAVSKGSHIQGGAYNGHVRAPNAQMKDLSAYNVNGSVLKVNRPDSNGEIVSKQETKSTTLAASAVSGDSQIELTAHEFVEGERIQIGGSENHYVKRIVDDATNGAGNIVELDGTLSSSYSSGSSVSTNHGNDNVWVDEFGGGHSRIEVEASLTNGVVADGGVTSAKVNGLWGGGGVGGLAIGSLTDGMEGDRARADGTNASAAADELFVLKSNGDWQSLADPATTITPS